MTTNAVLRLKRGLAANWTAVNPVLDHGEPGYESDTGQLKFGDGDSNWNDLSYFSSAVGPHDHNDLYFTEAEVAALLAGKSDTGHDHDASYYTEAEVDGLIAGVSLGGIVVDVADNELITNVTTTSTSFVDLLTLQFNLSAQSTIFAFAHFNGYNTSIGWTDFQIDIDGIAKSLHSAYRPATNNVDTSGIVFVANVPAGVRDVKFQWKVETGTAVCNASAADGRYTARLTAWVVEE